MSDTSVSVNLRIPAKLLERIDKSAERAGQSRVAYVLSWLPDAFAGYDAPAERAAHAERTEAV